MTGKKKVFIGAGVVVVLGAVAFANFKFKKTDGVTVNTEAVKQRKLEAIVSASGKIQAKRFVNISADTSGRVTELAVNEGDRVKEGQFLLQIDPRNLRTRVQSGEASLGAAPPRLLEHTPRLGDRLLWPLAPGGLADQQAERTGKTREEVLEAVAKGRPLGRLAEAASQWKNAEIRIAVK